MAYPSGICCNSRDWGTGNKSQFVFWIYNSPNNHVNFNFKCIKPSSLGYCQSPIKSNMVNAFPIKTNPFTGFFLNWKGIFLCNWKNGWFPGALWYIGHRTDRVEKNRIAAGYIFRRVSKIWRFNGIGWAQEWSMTWKKDPLPGCFSISWCRLFYFLRMAISVNTWPSAWYFCWFLPASVCFA